ncbi:ABC-2 transporter permease [Paenibacillus lemnae]|uniref:ABC-2 transporter permease n=1 Tax=Paenibacillus lemnae TaxID=1330551 RepID=A0A848MDB4_PAELE|nr:ABC-2 transporter permease [Paenibacillus lemnae]NMO98032.1 ABC-2 transporter permease [Paenibacillus lemnae]
MLNMLRKDYIALKSSQWIVILYLVVFSTVFIPRMDMSMYFVGIYTAIGSIMLATMVDIKNHNHRFLITLPINRKHIVKAKYLTAIAYMLFAVFSSFGIHWLTIRLFPLLDKPNYTFNDIIISIGIILLLISVYMPLFYALSHKSAAVINAVFLVALIVLAQPAAQFIHWLSEESQWQSPITLFVYPGILLLFLVSYLVSVKLFSRRDI